MALMLYYDDMIRRRSTRRGFTVVELAFVIVILALLVLIAVTGYNGLRDRSYNLKMVNGVKQYYEAVETYKAKYGHYPQTSIERDNPTATVALTCLGTGYVGGGCGSVTYTNVYENSYFNSLMEPLIENPPALGELKIDVQPETFTGAVYGIDHTITGGTGYGRTIQWALIGEDADCKVPGVYSYRVSSTPPTTACEILLEPVVR